jgi:hypothetical protein
MHNHGAQYLGLRVVSDGDVGRRMRIGSGTGGNQKPKDKKTGYFSHHNLLSGILFSRGTDIFAMSKAQSSASNLTPISVKIKIKLATATPNINFPVDFSGVVLGSITIIKI